jgi:uncharacterized membrane protein YgdD (TMEM256/DUF423 family)
MFVRVAAVFGFLAVALGAFGAHALKARLDPAALEIWRTAALYHLVHAVAMLAVALGGARVRWGTIVCGLFTAGIAVFGGTLYLLAATGVRWLGAITPIGGLAFMAGWVVLAAGGLRAVDADRR